MCGRFNAFNEQDVCRRAGIRSNNFNLLAPIRSYQESGQGANGNRLWRNSRWVIGSWPNPNPKSRWVIINGNTSSTDRKRGWWEGLPSDWMTIFGSYDLGWPIRDDQKRWQGWERRQRSNFSRCRNEVDSRWGWPIKIAQCRRRSRDNHKWRTTRWWWCQSDNFWGTRCQRGNPRRHVCLVSSYTL